MELAFSPDLPAWLCYVILLVVATFAAWRKVTNRLRAISGPSTPAIWYFGNSWLLLALYVAIPILLFWLLDRTEAIQDTSLFAALTIAVAFERIMSATQADSGAGAIAVSQGVRSLWTPFKSYVDRTVTLIERGLVRDARRWDKRALDAVLTEDKKNPGAYPLVDRLKAAAESITSDRARLDAQIKEVDALGTANGADFVRERKARIWYAEIAGHRDYEDNSEWQYFLFEEKVVGWLTYLQRPISRSRIVLGFGVGVIAAILVGGYVALDRPPIWTTYDLWRVRKAHTTVSDLEGRTRESLEHRIAESGANTVVFDYLTALLRDPELRPERSDFVLRFLLEHRCRAEELNVHLVGDLITALRTSNVDIRNRVHHTLITLTPPARLSSSLKEWNASVGDTIFDLEGRIAEWNSVWRGAGGTSLCDLQHAKAPASSDGAVQEKNSEP